MLAAAAAICILVTSAVFTFASNSLPPHYFGDYLCPFLTSSLSLSLFTDQPAKLTIRPPYPFYQLES